MSPLLDFFTDWLVESATIQRAPAAVVDDTGSGRKDYVVIASGVPCQLQIGQGAFLRALYTAERSTQQELLALIRPSP